MNVLAYRPQGGERWVIPEGCRTAFARSGYRFDAAPAGLPLVAAPTLLQELQSAPPEIVPEGAAAPPSVDISRPPVANVKPDQGSLEPPKRRRAR